MIVSETRMTNSRWAYAVSRTAVGLVVAACSAGPDAPAGGASGMASTESGGMAGATPSSLGMGGGGAGSGGAFTGGVGTGGASVGGDRTAMDSGPVSPPEAGPDAQPLDDAKTDVTTIARDAGPVTRSDAASPTDGGAGILGGVCPNCKPLFDGATLNGWNAIPANSWIVQNGALHSLGTARGVLYTDQDFDGTFRIIFHSIHISHTSTDHVQAILFWGTRPPPSIDALAAIQVQPPLGYMWDYRAGKNVDPGSLATHFSHPAIANTQWSQCEVLVHTAMGELTMACCQLTGTATSCNASRIVQFKDPTAGQKGPFSLQVHNAGLVDEFKNIYFELNPTVDALVTMH